MKKPDLVIISKSDILNYEKFSDLPIDRIDLFKDITQLRMVYLDNGFRSPLDILNKILYRKFFSEATFEERRKMLNIWNLFSLNSVLATAPLTKEGYDCRIINNFDAEFDLLVEYCSEDEKPIIAISTTFILSWSEIVRIIKKIRSKLNNIKIILGGAFINSQFLNSGFEVFEKPMRKHGIDFVLHSFNSEFDLLQLVKNYKSNDFSKVNNLIYINEDDEFKITKECWNEPNIEICPIKWNRVNLPLDTNVLQIRTSSGCPFQCSFCTYPVLAKGYHYSESTESLRLQLEQIKSLGTINHIIFIDDTLNVPIERFKKILKVLSFFDFNWYSFLRVQFINDEIVKEMKKSGCDGVYLGIESANDEILSNMNKKVHSSDYMNGIQLLNKYKIPVLAAFVVGFPGETDKTIKDNISFIEEGNISFFSLKEFYYMHNAPIHNLRDKFDLTGDGNTWKHNTMNSNEANHKKIEIFKSSKKSTYIDSDTSLWHLVYLRSKGYSWEDIKNIQSIFNRMFLRDIDGDYFQKDDLMEELTKILNCNY